MFDNQTSRKIDFADATAPAIDAELKPLTEEAFENDTLEIIPSLMVQLLRYETAIDSVSQGICFYDGDQRLILSNRRYAEIYKLDPALLIPGTTLKEIAELRLQAGTCPSHSVEDYLSWCDSINVDSGPKIWNAELKDGRTIRICHQSMEDHGWVSTHEDISEKVANVALSNQRLSLQNLIDAVPDYLWVKDTESRFIVANKALAADWGISDPNDMVGLSDSDYHAPELANVFREREAGILRSETPMIDREEFVIDAAGTGKWLSSTKIPLRNGNGEIFGLVGIARDITERKRAEALRDGQAKVLEMIATSEPLADVLTRLVLLIESQLDGVLGSILLLDSDGVSLIGGAAPSLAEPYNAAINGVRIGPDVGSCGTAAYRAERVVVTDIQADPLWANFRGLAAQFGYRSCWSTPVISYEGTVLGTFALYSATVRAPTEDEIRLVDLATKIAGIAIERKQSEDRIRYMASHDVLTGLSNRAVLKERLNQAITHATRNNRGVSVLFIDLDNFKLVNDSLGHNIGDELLKGVAARMEHCVRASDTVVRLGGDEFVIMLTDQARDQNKNSAALTQIRDAITAPMVLDGHQLRVTCSMGIASYPGDGEDSDTLLANADAAMYRAKENGRDNFQFYSPELNTTIHKKFLLQEELRDAIANGDLFLNYQPQVDLRSGEVFAVEALLRWNHPTLGLMSPMQFIPLAEESGLIVPIGNWVLVEACRQNKAWQDAGLPPINVCINVSARQFREKNLVDSVIDALQVSGMEGKYLELELTESLVMHNVEQAIATMNAIQALGVQLSIDDFGTGYSSLSALKNFPVARLKIDKSFVNELPTNENDKAVASAIISLGQKLNLRVIAEGVETSEQVQFLRDNNCDEIQGYHFSKPVLSGEIEKILRRGKMS